MRNEVGPYKKVTPYFLLQVLYQDWGSNPAKLKLFCDGVQSMGVVEKTEGRDVGPVLDGLGEKSPFSVEFDNLWHFDPPIAVAPRSDRAFRGGIDAGVHPDVVIQYLLERCLAKGRPAGAVANQPVTTRQWLELLHGEIRRDADIDYPAIDMRQLENKKFPKVNTDDVTTGTVRELARSDIVDVLIVIVRMACPPYETSFYKFLEDHGAKIATKQQRPGTSKSASRWPIKSLALLGKNEDGKYELKVNDKTLPVSEGQMEKILALAIAKLRALEGEFPGLLSDRSIAPGGVLFSKLGVREIRRVIESARKGLCGVGHGDTTTGRGEYKRNLILQETYPKPPSHPTGYQLACEASDIDISGLVQFIEKRLSNDLLRDLVSFFKKHGN